MYALNVKKLARSILLMKKVFVEIVIMPFVSQEKVMTNYGYRELTTKLTRAEFKAFAKWVLSEELDHFDKQALNRAKIKLKKGENL